MKRISNGGRCDVAIAFVVRLSDARPDTVHQFFMVFCAVVKATISLSERVRFFASGNEISFWGKARNNDSNFTTSGIITRRSVCHVYT